MVNGNYLSSSQKFTSMTFAMALALAPMVPVEAAGLERLLGDLTNLVAGPQSSDLSACEAQSSIAFLNQSGCPGFLDAFYHGDLAKLRGSAAHVVIYTDALVTPLYADMTFFMQGGQVMHAMPARLPHKLAMLKLRTPEVLALRLSDGLRMAEKVVTPMLNAPSGDVMANLRASMRDLGVEPMPSTILPALGHHDSYLMQSWAEIDPDGFAEFMRRIEAMIEQL